MLIRLLNGYRLTGTACASTFELETALAALSDNINRQNMQADCVTESHCGPEN